MSAVDEIIQAVKRLDEGKKSEFLERLFEINFDDAWDRKIEDDVKSGKLDAIWNSALAEIRSGETKPLDEVLNDE